MIELDLLPWIVFYCFAGISKHEPNNTVLAELFSVWIPTNTKCWQKKTNKDGLFVPSLTNTITLHTQTQLSLPAFPTAVSMWTPHAGAGTGVPFVIEGPVCVFGLVVVKVMNWTQDWAVLSHSSSWTAAPYVCRELCHMWANVGHDVTLSVGINWIMGEIQNIVCLFLFPVLAWNW